MTNSSIRTERPEQRPSPAMGESDQGTTSNAVVQLKRAIQGLSFAEQEQRLAPPPDAGSPVQMKGEDEGFKKVADAKAPIKQGESPASMQLPEEVTGGLKTAWGKSFPGGQSQEQGGIIVKNKDGSYGFKESQAGQSGSISNDYGNKGADQEIVGSAHTHPYDASEGGHTGVSFSGADIANLVWQPDKLKVVEAGGTQFVIVRTEEFQKLVTAADTEAKKEKLQDEIKACWNDAFKAATGKLPDRAEAAVKATVSKYKLSYYKGKEGKVERVDASK